MASKSETCPEWAWARLPRRRMGPEAVPSLGLKALQEVAGAGDDGFGQAGHAGHRDAEGAVGGAVHDAAEEDHLAARVAHRHAAVSDGGA